MAKILDDSGQHVAAQKLREYNTPKKITEFSNNIELPVQTTNIIRSGQSRWFPMDGIPRGKALIFVSIWKLLPEAKRFASIFEQLYFDVEIHAIKSCGEMLTVLKAVSQEAYPENALIVMYIGHGCDERIWISNEEQKRICEIVKNAHTLRSGASRWFVMDSAPRGQVIVFLQLDELKKEADRFNHIFQQLYFSVDIHVNYSCDKILDTLKHASRQEFKKDALIVMFIGHGHDEMIQGSGHGQDEIHIKKLIDQFSERNCHPSLRPKPKIFVFNCCRIKTDISLEDKRKSIDGEWMDGTTRTYICYACAEGIQAFYSTSGYTLFGQAFSHCIAEYACDSNLTQIFSKTCEELNRADMPQRPELTMKNVDRDLYFNPGLFKG
ncbi:unnamed protein product [Oppiella nova]|uniref:Caspase family p20 domain-containing protein n=1 Tax=Oppiella nova TaxID=334625 RepID=A0A7R9M206_9ACAR|nr:unnamed protein product [Oppiella nova]CAG2169069.1 unnamed protein product [Oppiella nova]